MATKNPEAAKAAKQKKMLIVLGVALVGLGAFQAPKLLGGSNEPAAAEASDEATAPGVDAAQAAPTPTPSDAVAVGTPPPPLPLLPGEEGKRSPTATLVGVRIASGKTVRVSQGQLASFSLFAPKDPFAPQVTDGDGGSNETTTATPAATPAAKDEPAESPPATTTPDGADATPTTTVDEPTSEPTEPVPAGGEPAAGDQPAEEPAAPVEPPRFATLSVNGIAESVEVGSTFPKDQPLFVLAKVKEKGIEVGIAGGTLENGETAQLKLEKTLTLVDSASGVRYEIELISVGATPDLAFTSVTTATQQGTGVSVTTPTTDPTTTTSSP